MVEKCLSKLCPKVVRFGTSLGAQPGVLSPGSAHANDMKHSPQNKFICSIIEVILSYCKMNLYSMKITSAIPIRITYMKYY